MGSLSSLYISQSYQSLAHLGTNNALSAGTMTILQDGLGNSLNISFDGTNISSSGNIYGANITASVINTGSLVTTSSFNSYTSSTNARLTSIETTTASLNNSVSALNTNSASVNISISALNTFTASQSTASIVTSINNLNTFTSSANVRLNNLETTSASVNVSISNLNSTSASQATSISNLNTSASLALTTASLSGQTLTFTKGNGSTFGIILPDVSGSDITALNQFTASQLLINTGYNTFTSSTNTSISSLNTYTASQSTASLVTSINNLNTFSASTLVSISNLNSTTQSLNTSVNNLNTTTSSLNTSVSNLNTATASLFTSTSLSLTTASFNNGTRDLTFTKGNGTIFSVNIPDASGSAGDFVTTASFNAYTQSVNSDLNSIHSTTASLNSTTASQQISINALNTNSASVNTSITNINQFTQSANIRLNNLETTSASVNVSITNLNQSSASQQVSIDTLNQYTASQSTASLVTSITELNTFSASAKISISALNSATSSYVTETESGSFLITASFDNGNRNLTFTKGDNTTFNVNIPDVSGSAGTFVTTSSFNDYTSSNDQRVTSLESNSASVNISISNINQTTASLNSSVTQLNASSASQQVSIDALNTFTASQSTASIVTSINNLNTFSASALVSISNINSTTASLNSSVSQLNASSASQQISIDNLNAATSSYITESETASFARTNVDNNFTANQTFTNISAVSASFTYLTTLYETASVIYSSGSNQLGDELTDIQTLSGSVKVQGSLTVNGTPVLTSSVDISGLVTTASFNAYTQSNDQKVTALETNSASVNTSITNINATTASLNTSVTNLNQFTASQSTASLVTSITNLNTFSASALVSISNLNSTTASLNTSVSNLNTFSASTQTSINALNTFTASQSTASLVTSIDNLNTFSASALVSITNINSTTQSLNTSVSNLNSATSSLFASASLALITASFDNGTRNLTFTKGDTTQFSVNIPDVSGSTNFVTTSSFNQYTQSNDQRVSSLETNSASVNISISNINSTTASLNTSVTNLNVSSASQQVSIDALNTNSASVNTSITNINSATASLFGSASLALTTASFDNGTRNLTFTKGDNQTFSVNIPDVSGSAGTFVTTASFNAYTQSNDQRVSSLETNSGSVNTSIANINTFTQSANISINALNAATASYATSAITASSLITASFSGNTLTFTKGDASTFGVVIPDVSGSTIDTGSFATTGSNTFTGNQLINKNGAEYQLIDPSIPQAGTTSIGISGASGGLIFKQSGSVLIEGNAGSTGLVFYGTGSFNRGIAISDSDFVAGVGITYDTTNDVVIIQKDGSYKPSLNIEGGLTASLENGYAWVGNASGRTVAVATSSFGGGGGGNFATTGSNTFTGDQTLIDNAGNFYTISDASGSMMLVAKGFTSASAHISASAAGIGNFIFKTNNNTATTTLSGSNNIFTNTGNPTAGFRRYLTSGNISMMGALPQISASMAFSPTISNNSFIIAQATGNPITIRGPISSSTYTINSNQIFNAVNLGSSAANNAEKIVAGISLNSNIIQTLSIVANRTNTTQTVSISNNQLQGTTTLNMNSSSIDLSNNLWYGTNTITNNSTGSSRVSAAGNAVGLVNNILLGTNTITFSGSNDPNDTQDLDYQGGMYRSMIIGTNTPFVQTGPTGSNSITNTAIIGNGLIVTGSSGNPIFGSDSLRHGSVFVGRFNDVSGNKDLTAETIFAVGTGTSTSARKTGFLIDSGSNTFVEGTLNVSGSTTLSGSLYIQSGSTLPSATGSSILTWNPTTGQVSQSPIATLISSSFSVGAFNSTITQSGSAAVSQSMTFNNTDISNGVSIVSNSQITLANTGTYNIQFSAQLLASTGADTIWIWLKKNGTNVSNTGTKLVLKNNEANVAAWNFVVPANASDYFELVWQSLDGHATLLTEAASGNYPAIPSIIVTVTQVE